MSTRGLAEFANSIRCYSGPIFGTLALASRLDLTRQLARDYEKPALTDMHADEVIAAAMKIKQ